MSISELARRFHHSRRKIREILATAEPKPYQRRPMPSTIDRFQPIIEAILKADETAPPKQQHTAAKIFRRLRDEHGYAGSYNRVRRYVLTRSLLSGPEFAGRGAQSLIIIMPSSVIEESGALVEDQVNGRVLRVDSLAPAELLS
jgi:hypothetical protein